MTEKAWKPKRASDTTPDSSSDSPLVELSVRSSECKSALEEVVGGIKGVKLKESQSAKHPAVIILELEDNPEQTFCVIREMGKDAKGTEIFLTSSTLDSAVLLEGMRAGAKEFLAQPIQKKEVEEAFKRFFERFNLGNIKNDERKKAGKMIAFFGGKGGVGTTSIAVNLAAALVNLPTKPSVVLVDVNQHGGDLPLYLDLQPNHSFRDIASDLTRLDHTFLIRVLTKCENGLQVLASGYDDLSTGRLSPACVETALALLQSSFDYIILDCGHVLDLTTKKGLEMADLIFVTSALMVPVVHRTKRILELLRGSGFPPQKICLVMNRYSSAEKDVLQETEDILKQKAHWLFPNDYPSVSQAVNSGKSIIEIAPKSSVGKSYMNFARSFDEQSNMSQGKSSVFSWFRPFTSRKTQTAES